MQWRLSAPQAIGKRTRGIGPGGRREGKYTSGMSWTDERIEKLTKMWEGGATASQIADELGGVSRNAVIGKAHRLGLKARPSPVKPNEKEAGPAPAPKPPRGETAPSAPRPAPAPKADAAPVKAASAEAAPAPEAAPEETETAETE